MPSGRDGRLGLIAGPAASQLETGRLEHCFHGTAWSCLPERTKEGTELGQTVKLRRRCSRRRLAAGAAVLASMPTGRVEAEVCTEIGIAGLAASQLASAD